MPPSQQDRLHLSNSKCSRLSKTLLALSHRYIILVNTFSCLECLLEKIFFIQAYRDSESIRNTTTTQMLFSQDLERRLEAKMEVLKERQNKKVSTGHGLLVLCTQSYLHCVSCMYAVLRYYTTKTNLDFLLVCVVYFPDCLQNACASFLVLLVFFALFSVFVCFTLVCLSVLDITARGVLERAR